MIRTGRGATFVALRWRYWRIRGGRASSMVVLAEGEGI